jgi:tRNA nucleotidyltransferase/poly(A) polymerase
MIQFDSKIFPQTKGAYIVGGSIRDLLLGRTPVDYDIAVLDSPEKFAGRMAAESKGHLVKLGRPGWMIHRVITDKNIFDISPVNGTTIESDLSQRDFTINAMAYDLYSGETVDVLGGLQDLEARIVRMGSKNVFKKDPIRLLRAFRMGTCLDFDIESRTISTIQAEANLIQESAGERIRHEIFKMFDTPNSHHYLSQMAATGLLFAIFPELEALKGCLQNRHHHYDVFEHSMQAYHHLEDMLGHHNHLTHTGLRRIIAGMDKNKAALLKYAILLHDIGKPPAKSIDKRGITHFYGHARKSADMAKRISQRLKLSARETDFADFIIRSHIRPLSLFTARQNNALTPKGLARFYMKCGEETPFLLLHALADSRGKHKSPEENNAFIAFIEDMIADFLSMSRLKSQTPPLITGYDLIERFGLTPSPAFKKILKHVEEAKLSRSIESKSAALKLVSEYLKRQEDHNT